MSAVNEYHTNVYERITDIMYLLYEADGISVCELASKYQLPPETILEDLKYMLESEALNIFLFPYEEELDTDEFSEELLHGKHNDVRLYAERTDDDYMVSLQLSSFEKIFLHGFLQAHDPEGKFYETQEIFMKHTPEETSGEVLQMIRQIKEAIHGHFRLLINARTKEGIRTMEVVPAEIVKMVSDGSCYCMAAAVTNSSIFGWTKWNGSGSFPKIGRSCRKTSLSRSKSGLHTDGECAVMTGLFALP